MYLECVRSKELKFLEDHEYNYLTTLINRIDLEQLYPGFLEDYMDDIECCKVAWLIQNHIEENKIFEMNVDGIKKPIIVDNNVGKLPENCQALSMESLMFLGEVTQFLENSRKGIEIIDN